MSHEEERALAVAVDLQPAVAARPQAAGQGVEGHKRLAQRRLQPDHIKEGVVDGTPPVEADDWSETSWLA